jgi:hypothetical protein
MHDERTLYDVWMAARMTYVINACMHAGTAASVA